MSPPISHKPKSDALQLHPLPPPEKFATCPHADDIKAMRGDLHRLTVAMAGEVDSNTPGMQERMRDLEQSRRDAKFWTRAALTAALGAFVTTLWALITGKSS